MHLSAHLVYWLLLVPAAGLPDGDRQGYRSRAAART